MDFRSCDQEKFEVENQEKLMSSRNMLVLKIGLHNQKRHRLVETCQFYELVVTCQPVTINLSIP